VLGEVGEQGVGQLGRGRGDLDAGRHPQLEPVAVTRPTERAARAVAPPALDPDLLHQPRREHPAEAGLEREHGRGVGLAVARPDVAEAELGLGPFGLIDQDDPRRSTVGGGRDLDQRALGPGRQALGQRRREPRGAGLADVAGDADHQVVDRDLAPPQRGGGGAIEGGQRRLGAERGARVRVTRADLAIEPSGRQRGVVVADLVEELRALAAQPGVLVLGEAGGGQDVGEERGPPARRCGSGPGPTA
jgi:hypothetical protein